MASPPPQPISPRDEESKTKKVNDLSIEVTEEKAESFRKMIDKLILVKNKDESPLNEEFVLNVLDYADAVLLQDCTLIPISTPIVICGDIHGDYATLLRIFSTEGWPPTKRYLFLGDYVDRGTLSVEVMTLLLLFKILYPEDFFLLRGNHEMCSVNRMYGFKREVSLERFTKVLWVRFQTTFSCLPMAALVQERIFCVHGGVSFRLTSLDQIRRIRRPINIPNDGFLLDFLWADPSIEAKGYVPNEMRNASFFFGIDTLPRLFKLLGIDMVVRAHEVVPEGFEVMWDGKLVTVFSCPNYTLCNKAGVMKIDENMAVTFTKYSGRRDS